MSNIVLTDDHKYFVDDKPCPGFSEILNDMGIASYWNRDPWYLERGSIIHAETEKIDAGTLNWSTVDPRLEGYLEAYEQFKMDLGITWQHPELKLHSSTYWYCGKPDRVIPGIWDIKTGEHDELQLPAYRFLCIENYFNVGYDCNNLRLYENGRYRIDTVKPLEIMRLEKRWLEIVNTYHYRKERRNGK
jgi:hypothetical protein